MLDTNMCIYVMQRRPPALRRRFESLDPSEVAVSGIVAAELWTGVMKSQLRLRNQAALAASTREASARQEKDRLFVSSHIARLARFGRPHIRFSARSS